MPAARKRMAVMASSFAILPVRKCVVLRMVPIAAPKKVAEGILSTITIISTTPQEPIIVKKSHKLGGWGRITVVKTSHTDINPAKNLESK